MGSSSVPPQGQRHRGRVEGVGRYARPRAGGPRLQPRPGPESYQAAGIFVAGLDATGDTEIRDLALATAPLALVVGSEGRGLSRLVAQRCDVLVRIPIAARTESLNAGFAAGIALYEVATVRSRAGAAVTR